MYIHLGFHKTGTSWLQTVLFPILELEFLTKRDVKDRAGLTLRYGVANEEMAVVFLKAAKSLTRP